MPPATYAMLIMLCAAPACLAQVIDGRLVDSAGGMPVVGVTVSVGDRHAVSDGTGRFLVTAAQPGRWRVELRRIGYVPRDTMIAVQATDTVRIVIAMARVSQRLDTVTVSASADAPGSLPEFEARRARKLGHYITTAQLRQNDERRFSDVLRSRLPGLAFEETDRGTFLHNRAIQPPGALLPGALKRPCYVQVVLDGIPIYRMGYGSMAEAEPFDVSLLLARNFDAVEWYSGPSRTPPEFRTTGAHCGTIVFWSRRK